MSVCLLAQNWRGLFEGHQVAVMFLYAGVAEMGILPASPTGWLSALAYRVVFALASRGTLGPRLQDGSLLSPPGRPFVHAYRVASPPGWFFALAPCSLQV